MLGNFFKTELANFSKTDELLGVNEDPMLLELAGQLKDADKEKTRLEADEVRLKSILRWGKIDEPGRTRPATDADVAEANARLKADLGVTLPSHFYLPEARAAKAHREKLQAEYEQLGKQSRERLRPQLCEVARPFDAAIETALAELLRRVDARQGCAEEASRLLGIEPPEVNMCKRLRQHLEAFRVQLNELRNIA